MITINQEICIGCGLCTKDCSSKFIEIKDKKAVIATANKICISCGHCLAVCPREAIIVNNHDRSEVLPFNSQTMRIDAEQLFEFMQYRRSTRQFTDKPVEREKLEKIVEAGRYSPTGSNAQKVQYIVLQNQLDEAKRLAVETLYKMAIKFPDLPYIPFYLQIYEEAKQNKDLLFHNAPAVIAVIDNERYVKDSALLAASRMELMANALGLGVCFIGIFVETVENSPELNDLLEIDSHGKLVAALAIGYPVVNYLRTVPRKPANVRWK
jgi:nitroreductase/NAD-dependent dihydropyrimidine dehydrogenase PreA subunit